MMLKNNILMFLSFEIKEKRHTVGAFALLPIPKIKAAQYGKHQELLIPDVNVKLNDEAELIPGMFSFSGPERDEYLCKGILLHHLKGRFIVFENQTVLDKQTELMWASRYNGRDINWNNAKRYCENYQGGGYTDRRLPGINELEELFRAGYKDVIKLTNCCV